MLSVDGEWATAVGSNRRLIALFVTILAIVFAVMFLIFGNLLGRYRDDAASESAGHLVEINVQMRTAMEQTLEKDQTFTDGLAISLALNPNTTEADLLAYLEQQRATLGVESIRIYTESGVCIDQDGNAQSIDKSSAFAYQTVRDGHALNIIDSMMEYSTATDTSLTLRGSRVVAVSTVRNLATVVDNMGLSSFSGEGYVYLARRDGVKVSQSSGENVPVVFNATSLFSAGTMTCLSDQALTLRDAMDDGIQSVFIYKPADGSGDRYVVMSPFDSYGEPWYLFTVVPESSVNLTMDSFISYATMLEIWVFVVVTALLAVFYLVYRARARRYASDVQMRERLFDLLVSETDTAFLLLSEKKEGSAYASSNAQRMIGSDMPVMTRTDGHLRLTGADGSTNAVMDDLNGALATWDGTSDFSSGYISYGRGSAGRYLLFKLYPVREQDGEYIGVAQDVTDERQREDELRSALALADSANRAKTRFLSSMSHDIRTPMNAIVNMTRFAIADADDPKRTRGYLEVIQTSSEHLLSLINDVLDMSRIESGKLTFSSEPFDLETLISSVHDIIEPLCEEKTQTFGCECVGLVHTRLLGDSLRLRQILVNLLNNAVKFTPRSGHVTLTVRELPSLKQATAAFRFEVVDDGIGIDKEAQERIFDPFSRVEDQIVRGTEGSGLGLSITRNFVDALGGTISVKSALGKGSTFSVELFYAVDTSEPTLPAPMTQDDAESAAEEREKIRGVRFDGYRALLVEDNKVNRMIAEMMLGNLGFEVDDAVDGEQAVEMYLESDGVYDIIFMDIQMPAMNGYQATEAIRASGRADATTVPIIAMTANVFAEDVERARHAGMNGHVGKPIDPEELKREAIHNLNGGRL